MSEVTSPAVNGSAKEVDLKGGTEEACKSSTSENGVSSANPENKSPEKSEGEMLLAQGKRFLFIKDHPQAVAVLGEACEKLVNQYGELADECAEVYFSYGRALLELAREESNVLGTEPEREESEDEGDNGEEENPAEGAENPAEDDSESKAASEDKGSEVDDNSKNEDLEQENPADETKDTTKEINETDQEKDEDPDNLQLAWEVFELAKKIFERQNADAKLAETFLYLGEVALESENFYNAIEDMKHCVEIQQKILPPDHRDIAETFFQMGVACSFCNEFDNAISHFKTSHEILENRIKNLLANGTPADKQNIPFYSTQKEIEEIKTLLPEIKVKISDMEDFKRETIKGLMTSLKEQPQVSDGTGASSSTSSSSIVNGTTPKPATNISHLVRKKRKPEEEVLPETVVKKNCTDEVKK